jgi:predicted RNA-binding Zn-ribbon protein involved in translation (DUF1610 family)
LIVTIIIIVLVLAILGAIAYFLSIIVNKIKYVKNTIQQLQLEEEMDPTPKSVSGATDLYLRQIQKDFPDYHHSDTELALEVFINEYLEIVHQGINDFKKSNVDPLLIRTLQQRTGSGNAYNIRINRTSICGYKKTDEYATIQLQVSVGYHWSNKRIETKYNVNYTFSLTNDNIASEAMECKNCGAPFESTTATTCPYCGAKIVRDTIMSWKFSSISEI